MSVTLERQEYDNLINAAPVEGKIHEAIAAIMLEIGGVQKTRTNPSQNYKFKGIADIYLAAQPVMAKHKVHMVPHRILADECKAFTTSKGNSMLHVRTRIEFRFYHQDGSWFQCVTTGEAMDSSDKSSNKAMAASAKYALIQTFCIPDDDPHIDTESESPEFVQDRPAPAKRDPASIPGVKRGMDETTAPKPNAPAPASAPGSTPLRDTARNALKAYAAKHDSPSDKGGMAAATAALQEICAVKSIKDVPENKLAMLTSTLEVRR